MSAARGVTGLVLLPVLAALGGCSLETTDPCQADRLQINAPTTTILVGRTEPFDLSYIYRSCAVAPTPKWSSSNEAVARVSADGRVTGVAVGSALIRVEVVNRDTAVPVVVVAAP